MIRESVVASNRSEDRTMRKSEFRGFCVFLNLVSKAKSLEDCVVGKDLFFVCVHLLMDGQWRHDGQQVHSGMKKHLQWPFKQTLFLVRHDTTQKAHHECFSSELLKLFSCEGRHSRPPSLQMCQETMRWRILKDYEFCNVFNISFWRHSKHSEEC